jgi:hypothetical protein
VNSGGTLVIPGEGIISGAGKIDGATSGATIVAPQAVITANVASSPTGIVAPLVDAGAAVTSAPSGSLVALKGNWTITGTGTAANTVVDTGSDFSAKTLVVVGNLTVSAATEWTAIAVLGNITDATAAITGPVSATGNVKFSTAGQTALTGLSVGGALTAGAAVQVATGDVSVGDNSTVTGDFTVGTGALTIPAGKTLTVGANKAVLGGGSITAGTSVAITAASGNIAISGAATSSLNITTAGTFSAGDTLGASGVITVNGATATFTGAVTTAAPGLTIAGAAKATITAASNVVTAGPLTLASTHADGTLLDNSAGTIVLTGQSLIIGESNKLVLGTTTVTMGPGAYTASGAAVTISRDANGLLLVSGTNDDAQLTTVDGSITVPASKKITNSNDAVQLAFGGNGTYAGKVWGLITAGAEVLTATNGKVVIGPLAITGTATAAGSNYASLVASGSNVTLDVTASATHAAPLFIDNVIITLISGDTLKIATAGEIKLSPTAANTSDTKFAGGGGILLNSTGDKLAVGSAVLGHTAIDSTSGTALAGKIVGDSVSTAGVAAQTGTFAATGGASTFVVTAY